jgi:hypothetical protein
MKKNTLESTIRNLLNEESDAKKQWDKQLKPSIDIGGHKHDPSGPNKSHIEEDNVDESIASQFGKRQNRKKHPYKETLGALEKRRWGGNQSRTPSSYTEDYDHLAEEATKKVMKKISEKKSERMLGKTATGKPGNTIDTEPVKPELTGPIR